MNTICKKDKRVLVLSHNAFSKTQNNGKTLESFFRGWEKDAIAQLFLQPDTPDLNFCNNYFRMTDYEVLNNVFFGGRIGHRISLKNNEFEFSKKLNPIVKKLYYDRRSGQERKGLNKFIHKGFVARIPLFVSIRELLWGFSSWKTDKLIKWIREFAPEILFFQGSNCVFGYEIALWICKEFDIPLVIELTDDYTTNLYPWSVCGMINSYRYRKIFIKAIHIAYKIIAISSYMVGEYKKLYGGNYVVLMNSIDIKNQIDEIDLKNEIQLLYAGNLSLNRWKVLKQLGKTLYNINKEYGMKCKLNIYSSVALSEEIKNHLISINTINYGGTLNQDELALEIQRSNILVHVEAFDAKNQKITRLSISTKIPEYMAAKRCIFAIGPCDVASIRYLKENQYAQVAEKDDVKTIKSNLLELINNFEKRKQYIDAAYNAYCLRHHPDKAQKVIYEIIETACSTKFANG